MVNRPPDPHLDIGLCRMAARYFHERVAPAYDLADGGPERLAEMLLAFVAVAIMDPLTVAMLRMMWGDE